MAIEQGAAVAEEGLTAEQKAEQEAFAAEMAEGSVEADAVAPASTEPVVAPAPSEPVAEPVVERKEVIKGYTEEELQNTLALLPKLQKQLDTTNGTLGSRLAEQQQLIATLQAQRQAVGSLSPEKLTKLSKEYPELAEMLASDLNEYIGQGGQAAPVYDETKVLEGLEKRWQETYLPSVETTIERKLELKALAKKHADWKETASFQQDPQTNAIKWNNPKFGEWVQKQPPEVANKLITVWDADFVAEQLDKFKKASTSKPAAQDLDAAVLPRGTRRASAQADENDEDAAFRAEMARR